MAKKPKQPTNDLKEAIKFCSVANRDIGQPYQSHFMFGKGWLIAFDGVITAAHPLKTGETLCCPHGASFRAAINKASSDLAMTISPDGDFLSIVTGKLRANIPCIYSNDFPLYPPDESVGKIDNRLRSAIITCGSLLSENASELIASCLLLRSNSCVSTNSHILYESWHGLHMPELLIPKALATVLERIDKPLVSFGFSDTTITLYFDNGAWIKSQLYGGALKDYPDIDRVLAQFPQSTRGVPADLFEAIETLYELSEINSIGIDPDKIETNNGNAGYEIALAPIKSPCNANPKYLLGAKWATQWAVNYPSPNHSCFYFTGNVHGEPARAIIMGLHYQDQKGKQQIEDDKKVPF